MVNPRDKIDVEFNLMLYLNQWSACLTSKHCKHSKMARRSERPSAEAKSITRDVEVQNLCTIAQLCDLFETKYAYTWIHALLMGMYTSYRRTQEATWVVFIRLSGLLANHH